MHNRSSASWRQTPPRVGLFSALSLLGTGVTHDDADLTPWLPQLRAFHTVMASALSGHPKPLSWQKLLSGQLSELGGHYRFVLAQPRQDFHSLRPGGAAEQAIRTAAAKLEFVQSGAAQVRITGPVALADAQFATVAQGAVVGLIGSMVLITLWLTLAVRSWRLILPILGTLDTGADADTAVRRGSDRNAQPDLGRFRCIVRRHRGGLRHPVLGALSRGAARSQRSGCCASPNSATTPAARFWSLRSRPRRASLPSCQPNSAASRNSA